MARPGSLLDPRHGIHSDKGMASAALFDDSDDGHALAQAPRLIDAILTPFATVTGTSGVDFIHQSGDGVAPPSGTYNEISTATNGNDTVNGGGGNDWIYSNFGDDVINGGTGDDTMDGGGGVDTVTYVDAPSAVDAGLFSGAHDTHGSGIDTIVNVENITGSAFDDTLTGDSSDNVLIGGIGNDTLNGGNGQDILYGGEGDNALDGGAGFDIAAYGDTTGVVVDLAAHSATSTGGSVPGHDTLTSIEYLVGSAFADQMSGDAGNNYISGGAGNDHLVGRDGDDTLNGESGGSFQPNGGDDVLNGGNGDDVMYGGNGIDTADYGDSGAGVTVDLRIFGTAQDTVGAGHDTLSAMENIAGSAFADTLNGDGGANQLAGGGGGDTIHGNGGNDTLTASGASTNTLYGDAGNDTLSGAAGDDVLAGGAGNDTIDGGGGSGDIADFAGAHTDYTVTDLGTGVFTVTDTRTGTPDGTDSVTHVEYFRFSDGTFDPAAIAVGSAPIDGTSGSDFIHEAGDGATAPGPGYNAIATATEHGDTINGLGGNDAIYGAGGNDTLNGGDADDIVSGGTGDDTISGGDGNDVLGGGAGNNTIDGGNGFDIVTYYDPSATQGVVVDLVTHHATLPGQSDTLANIEYVLGGTFKDQISGDANNNFIYGDASDDILVGRGGDDTLKGGDGNDYLTPGTGDDVVDGGAGFDIVSYGDAASGVTVDLRILTAQNTGGGGTDTLSNVEYLLGTAFTDTLTGDATSNLIATGGGSGDVLTGLDGDDSLIDNGGGHALLDGGNNNDVLTGTNNNNDTFKGGAGNDTIRTDGTGNLAIFSGNTTDYFIAYNPNTQTYTVTDGRPGSPDGTDTTYGVQQFQFNNGTFDAATLATTTTTGTAGVDFIHKAGDGATPPGGAYNEMAVTTDNPDNVSGLGGDDVIYTAGSDDTISGGAGNDVLHGGAGNDTIDGGDDNDIIFGDGGSNTLTGGNGDDLFYGSLVSGAQNAINGGAGNNTISYAGASHGIGVNLKTHIAFGIGGTDTLTNITNAIGSDFGDTITAGDVVSRLEGGGGDDTLIGGLVRATLLGGDGNDMLSAVAGASSGAPNILDGGDGFDFANYSACVNEVDVDLRITTAQSTGGGGYQTLISIEYLIGTAKGDVLIGDSQSNFIVGGHGNDTLSGSGHTAGSGDTFAFTPGDGNDTITDFIAGDADGAVIYLRGFGISNFSQLSPLLSQSGADTVVTFDSNNHLTLHNVTMGDLNSGDFLFI